jgi:hypothetical protein
MGIDDLRLLSEAKAREVLVRVGLKEVQQLKIMQAVVPPRAAVSAQQQVVLPAASSPPLAAVYSLVLASLTPPPLRSHSRAGYLPTPSGTRSCHRVHWIKVAASGPRTLQRGWTLGGCAQKNRV